MNRTRSTSIRLTGSLALIGATASCADGLFYWPRTDPAARPADFEPSIDEVEFAAPNGPRLHGWWLRTDRTRRGTVVYCHGNNANVTRHARYVEWLPRYGYDVLVFDYRGYGRSQGEPTRAGTVADAIAAIDLGLAQDPRRTVVFGHSLGGAVGIVAAAERSAVRAVVAEATFASYRDVAAARAGWLAFLVPLLISSGHDPVDVLHRLPPRPLLVIHGTDDPIVPFELGEELFERAHAPKQFHVVAGGGHATPWFRDGDAFEQLVVSFFERSLARGIELAD